MAAAVHAIDRARNPTVPLCRDFYRAYLTRHTDNEIRNILGTGMLSTSSREFMALETNCPHRYAISPEIKNLVDGEYLGNIAVSQYRRNQRADQLIRNPTYRHIAREMTDDEKTTLENFINPPRRPRPIPDSFRAPGESVSPPIRHKYSSNSITPRRDANIHDSCKNIFNPILQKSGIPIQIKRFVNKLKKICNDVKNRENCDVENLGRIHQLLYNRYLQNYHPENNLLIDDVYENTELVTLLRDVSNDFSVSTRDLLKNLRFSVHNERHDVTINYAERDVTQDAGGVSRTFFTNIADQLFSLGFFKQLDGDSNIYCVNPDLDITPFIPLGHILTEKEEINLRKILFKSAGAIISTLLLNQIQLKFHLNKAILANLLYKEIDPDEYVYHYINDSKYKDLLLNTLSSPTPENLEALNELLNFDTEPDVELSHIRKRSSDDKKKITLTSFRTILQKYCKNSLIGEERYFDAFNSGFYIQRKSLVNRGFNIQSLDTLITGIEVTAPQIDEIIHKLHNEDIFSQNIEIHNRLRYNQICTWFSNILKDNGTHRSPARFPVEVLVGAEHLPQNIKDFKKQLLYFWTGSSNYNNLLDYQIIPSNSQHIVPHTCAPSLEIPAYITSQEQLYEQLLRTCTSTGWYYV
jgi:hypothetical protein